MRVLTGAHGRLLALGLLWGSSYVLIAVALRSLTAGQVAFGRQAVAALVLAPLLLGPPARALLRGRGDRLVLVALATVGAPTLLVAAGQRYVDPGLASILVATSPLLTAAIAWVVERSAPPGPRPALGVVAGFAGVVALVGLDVGASGAEVDGAALLLGASAGYAVGPFLLRRWFPDVPLLVLVAGTTAVSAVALLPVALASGVPGALPVEGLLAVAGLGIGGTALGWGLFYSLVRSDGPRTAALAQYLAPACTVILALLALQQAPSAGVLLGLALVVAGSWLAAAPTPASAPRRTR